MGSAGMANQMLVQMLVAALLALATASPRHCSSEKSCASERGPTSGGAMIQTREGLETKSMPLKSRVSTMESEVVDLKTRLAKLQVDTAGTSDVGAPPAVAAAVAPAQAPPE